MLLLLHAWCSPRDLLLWKTDVQAEVLMYVRGMIIAAIIAAACSANEDVCLLLLAGSDRCVGLLRRKRAASGDVFF